jgi:hypothetical protein
MLHNKPSKKPPDFDRKSKPGQTLCDGQITRQRVLGEIN